MKTKSFMNSRKAFSLVELMVVIAIIGILSAIAVPSYKAYSTKAKVADLLTIAQDVQSRIANLYSQGTSVASITDAGMYTTAPTTTYATTIAVAATTTTTGTAHCGGTTLGVGTITLTSAAATIGLASDLVIKVVGCVANEIITWKCGVLTADVANKIYLPTSCQLTITP